MKETKIMTTEQLSERECKLFFTKDAEMVKKRINAFFKDMRMKLVDADHRNKSLDIVLDVTENPTIELKQAIQALHQFLENLCEQLYGCKSAEQINNEESDNTDLTPADDEEQNNRQGYFFIGICGKEFHIEGTIPPIIVKAILDEISEI